MSASRRQNDEDVLSHRELTSMCVRPRPHVSDEEVVAAEERFEFTLDATRQASSLYQKLEVQAARTEGFSNVPSTDSSQTIEKRNREACRGFVGSLVLVCSIGNVSL